MDVQKRVAKNLRKIRVQRGISQEALAVDAGIDRTYVSRLEREQENPTILVMEKLGIALGVEIVEFFGDVNDDEIGILKKGRKPKK